MPSTEPHPTPGIDAVRALARVSRLIERASGELSLADYRVLSAIAEGEGRASRLAARLAIGKPTVSASVDSLHRRGLIERSTVAGDQRATALSLSASGRVLFDRVEAQMVTRMEALADQTPDAARVLESLSWLGIALEEAMTARSVAAAEGGMVRP